MDSSSLVTLKDSKIKNTIDIGNFRCRFFYGVICIARRYHFTLLPQLIIILSLQLNHHIFARIIHQVIAVTFCASIKKDSNLFVQVFYLLFYSVLIASNAESFMALLAGIYPAITPTRDENTKAVIISHKGMIDILGLSVAPVP